jgi:hypothetical protein
MECLYGDHQIDYHEFIETFFTDPTASGNKTKKSKSKKKDKKYDGSDKKDKTRLKMEDFMTQLSEHVSN